jgi:hypothetical protein
MVTTGPLLRAAALQLLLLLRLRLFLPAALQLWFSSR